jgi:hypothetical protein
MTTPVLPVQPSSIKRSKKKNVNWKAKPLALKDTIWTLKGQLAFFGTARGLAVNAKTVEVSITYCTHLPQIQRGSYSVLVIETRSYCHVSQIWCNAAVSQIDTKKREWASAPPIKHLFPLRKPRSMPGHSSKKLS